MKRRGLLLAVGVAGLAVAAGIGWVIRDELGFRERQRPHVSRALVFDGPMQPDKAGPIQVRLDCAGQSGPVTVKAFYLGAASEAGYPYAIETGEVFLDTVYATGRVGEVIDVPAAAFDRRARALIRDGEVQAEIVITDAERVLGSKSATPVKTTDVIAVTC